MNFEDSSRASHSTEYSWNDFGGRTPNFYSGIDVPTALELKQDNIQIFNNGYDMGSTIGVSLNGLSDANAPSISNLSSPSILMESHLESKQSNVSEESSSPSSQSVDKKQPKRSRSRKNRLEDQDAILIARDDSELTEEELVLKRKAQNRTAQRAFRERKESKMKELEKKLHESEEEKQRLLSKLEEIRKQNITIQTENDILKYKSRSAPSEFENPQGHCDSFKPSNSREFAEQFVIGTPHNINEKTMNKVYVQPEAPGSKLLAVGAVWDYIQLKCEEKQLDPASIDILGIMERLKGSEKCHGYGPAFYLDIVDKAIEDTFI